MTRTVVILTALLVALGSLAPASAQQIDGRDCDLAFKKLRQHVQAGVCREDSARSDAKGQGSVAQTADRHEKAYAAK